MPQLVVLDDMDRPGEVLHATRVVEMQVRVDDVSHVGASIPETLQLSVHRIVTCESCCPVPFSQLWAPLCNRALLVGDAVVDPRVEQNETVPSMLDDDHRRGHRKRPRLPHHEVAPVHGQRAGVAYGEPNARGHGRILASPLTGRNEPAAVPR